MASRAFWKSFRMFAPLAPDALDALSAATKTRKWRTGESIFRRGDEGDWLVAIETGRIRISLTTSAGRELVIRQAIAGEMLGELSLFDLETRSADATAAEP
ncbi:MAG: cyclic nucleotide-binding domain-containing protein, partial [Tabrizicola sp.]